MEAPVGPEAPVGQDGLGATWRLEVRPVPTDEELAALVVALFVSRGSAASRSSVAGRTGPSRWAMAGRYAGRSGITGGAHSGWGRMSERR